jgi:hypothetical protein
LNAPRLQPGDSSPTRTTKRVRVDAEGNILGD